uniref:WD_REPEATS_REGION domain-containing protein n=1 Tax=Macrostomum lignano TaxID=282301 RepID=A0A1I8F7X0_9PLAT
MGSGCGQGRPSAVGKTLATTAAGIQLFSEDGRLTCTRVLHATRSPRLCAEIKELWTPEGHRVHTSSGAAMLCTDFQSACASW